MPMAASGENLKRNKHTNSVFFRLSFIIFLFSLRSPRLPAHSTMHVNITSMYSLIKQSVKALDVGHEFKIGVYHDNLWNRRIQNIVQYRRQEENRVFVVSVATLKDKKGKNFPSNQSQD